MAFDRVQCTPDKTVIVSSSTSIILYCFQPLNEKIHYLCLSKVKKYSEQVIVELKVFKLFK